jgi:pectin methylesterase-like acyl-CoA thioesterase
VGGARMTSTGGSTGAGGTGGTASGAVCPPGITRTITVAKNGSGQFSTVQAAVDSIPTGSTDPVRIDIKAGTYYEQIKIVMHTHLCMVGVDPATTILTFDDSAAKAQARTGSTVNGHSFAVQSSDFSAANLTFENSCVSCGQAIALSISDQRAQFLNCRVLGNQDTLYAWKGTQYFRNCEVEGTVDFIYGGAAAIFDNCEIRSRVGSSVILAPNTDINSPYGLVVLGGKLTAASTVATGAVALGRPWGPDGAGVFLRVDMGPHIASGGFINFGTENLATAARFGEYLSTGPGGNASGRTRYQLSASQAANYTIAKVYGGAWIPSYSQ